MSINFISFCIKTEFRKITNFLDKTSADKDLPKFVSINWIEVYDQSQQNYDAKKEIRITTSILKSDLCDFSDAYVIVKGNITITKKTFTAADFEAPNNTAAIIAATNNANNTMFDQKSCFLKIMPNKPNSSSDNNNDIIHSILNSVSFDYRANFMENGVTQNNLTKNDVKIVVPLKHLSYFWRNLNIPLINSEVEIVLNLFKNRVLIDKLTREANYNVNPIVYGIDNPKNAIFQITDTKLYVAVVSLSKQNDIKLLEHLKSGFKRTIKWNKYRSQMTIQPQNNTLDYLIDPTFTNVNRLFVLSFPRNNNTDSRYFYSNYYVPKVKINDFNFLIDGKKVF